MGKVIDKLHEIREMTDTLILERYEKLISSRSVRTYLGLKNDTFLEVELGLIKEEMWTRLAKSHPLSSSDLKE